MSILDIAQSRKGKLRDGYSAAKAGVSVADTRVEYGTAVGDSSDGYVTIRMDNSPTDGTADFSVPCDAPITQGDRVSYISTKGNGKAISVGTLAQIAQDAEDIASATNQHFWSDTNGIHVSTDAEDPAGARNILINSLGILLRKLGNTLVSISETAIAFFDGSGNQVASFGSSGAVIGQIEDDESRTEISDDGMHIFQRVSGNDVAIADLGYGLGNSGNGSNKAPYYTLGKRYTTSTVFNSSSTYAVGDHVIWSNDGNEYVCISAITTPGPWNGNKWQLAVGNWSTAEGYDTTASGYLSHAEGYNASAIGSYSHAEGSGKAYKDMSHAEGRGCVADADSAHAEGYTTTASGQNSHAEGHSCVASASDSHAEGSGTVASGQMSHAQNYHTIAAKHSQTALGTYNEEDTSAGTTHPSGQTMYGDYALIVGNGTADNARSNALTVGWNGDITASGEVIDGFGNKLSTAGGGSQQNYYATCSTTASTQAKEITVAGWTPAVGDILFVKFTTANTHNTPKLKINGTSYNIIIGTLAVAATTNVLKWSANTTLLFMCTTATAFSYITARAAASIVPPDGAGHWYGTSDTADGTAGKTATINNFRLMKGATVDITFSKPQTSLQALTLNVNSTAAKAIYAHDSACSATYCIQWGAGETLRFVFSGSYWYVLNRDVVLYRDPTGVNANSSLTLSKSAANFSWLDFIYTDGSRTYSDRLYQPDGKATSLMRMVNSGTVQYVDSLMVSVSGTSVTTGNGMQSLLDSGVFSDTNCHINIIEIRGGF